MLMLDTDMRRAEALGMTWSDVSVENRSILIEQQFAADRSVRSPKSKKSVQRISISETLTSYLEFWKKEQAREMEAFGLEQVKGTPLVHSFERTKDRHPQVNFMDLNGFSRWFRNFSVENGFGKFEGVRTYHYVKETVDGETISKRYEHKEWLELRDYLRKHPKVREARHISTYESEHLPYGYSGLSSHTATAATARYCPPASEPAGGSSTPNISPTAQRVVDLAAKADIEDVMLCDLPGVLSFLGLPPETEMPPGNKGKTKLKKLYRKVAPNKAYHSGERAKDLISHLDMAEIRASAPVQELGCSSIRARGSFRLDWGRMAGRKQFRLVISVRKRNLRLNSVRKSRRKPFTSALNPYENGFRLAGQLPFLQFNFQFGFVFVEVVAHVGDGK